MKIARSKRRPLLGLASSVRRDESHESDLYQAQPDRDPKSDRLVTLITDIVTWFSDHPAPSGDGYFVKYTKITVTHYRGPDVLRAVQEECPEPKAGEVRVKVLAAGVSFPDVLSREGVHQETPRLPYTPGWDLVGLVDRTGEGVSTGPDGLVLNRKGEPRMFAGLLQPMHLLVRGSAESAGGPG